MRKCPQVKRHERVEAAMQGVDPEIDEKLMADVRKSVPADLWSSAQAEESTGTMEAIARISDAVIHKEYRVAGPMIEKLRGDLPVAWGSESLVKCFTDFMTKLTEVRYSPLCVPEMTIEMMQEVLNRFQPRVCKID